MKFFILLMESMDRVKSQRAVVTLLLCLGIALRVANVGNVSRRAPDEGIYSRQAETWKAFGVAGLRSLVNEYRADANMRQYPPPTRVGTIRLIALVMRLTGKSGDESGVLLALAASIGALLIAALVGMRFFPPWAAACGILFYAVSPIALAIARRNWTDAPVELIGVLLLWFTCEITRDSRRLLWFILLAVIGSIGLTVKEAVLIPYGLCGMWIIWIAGFERRQWRNVLAMLGAAGAGLAVALSWMAGSVGGWSSLIAIIAAMPGQVGKIPYAIEYCWGPPNLLLEAFWIVSPFAALMSAVGLYAMFTRAPETGKNPLIVQLVGVFGMLQLILAMMMKGWLDLRYLGCAFASFYLLAGLGFWFLAVRIPKWTAFRYRTAAATAALAVAVIFAAGDYARFQRMFVRTDMLDLSVKMIIDNRNQ